MPRGQHPNSKANLKKGNPETQFKKGEKRSKESIENQVSTNAKNAQMNYDCEKFAELLTTELQRVVGKSNGEPIQAKKAVVKKIVNHLVNPELNVDSTFIKLMEFVRDTIGEKPVEKIAVSEIDPAVAMEVNAIVAKYTNKGTGD